MRRTCLLFAVVVIFLVFILPTVVWARSARNNAEKNKIYQETCTLDEEIEFYYKHHRFSTNKADFLHARLLAAAWAQREDIPVTLLSGGLYRGDLLEVYTSHRINNITIHGFEIQRADWKVLSGNSLHTNTSTCTIWDCRIRLGQLS